MAAVVEAALVEETPKLREASAERVGVHTPRSRGLQPRRVDHVPAADERHELGGARGMLAGPPPLGHLTDTQVEARVEGVHQARLADARRAGQHGGPAPQQVAERGQPVAHLHRRGE